MNTKAQDISLSVCIPIFNHADRLRLQLDSIAGFQGDKSQVEFIVVDDASTDDLPVVLAAFRAAGWSLISARKEENGGRAAAMAQAVKLARGRFVMIMDGDDTFEAGALEHILSAIQALNPKLSHGSRTCVGFVFGTMIDEKNTLRRNSPPNGLICSLLSLRADHNVRGDLKEVVAREVITGALCDLFDTYRRVPTSLLWARISEEFSVLCDSQPVVRKVYLPGGMTKSLMSLRRKNIAPLLELYSTIIASQAYDSHSYRIRALFNYHRFLVWPHKGQHRIRFDAMGLPAIFGFGFGGYETIKYQILRGMRVLWRR